MDELERIEFSELLTKSFPFVNDHPDIAGLFRDAEILQHLGAGIAGSFLQNGITKVLAPEARGPVLGALVAEFLHAGLILMRKEGRNHPGADTRFRSEPIWNGEEEDFQTRSFDLEPADRVLVVDDWVTTGNTIRAAKNFVLAVGATYVGASVIVNKASSECLEELEVCWLVNFEAFTS